jgi:hypothetical protein
MSDRLKDKQTQFSKLANQIKYQLSEFETIELLNQKAAITEELKDLLSQLDKIVNYYLMIRKKTSKMIFWFLQATLKQSIEER